MNPADPGQNSNNVNAGRNDDFLAGDSEMAAMMRTFDFSDTPLGPVSGWPQSLRSAVNICLTTHFPIVLFWGQELAVLYNDAYIPMLADKHPWALGKTCEAVWNEIFDVIGPLLWEVMKTGVPFSTEDYLFIMQRKGYKEETHFQFSYGAARDESGAVGGIFCVAVEITERVFYERRLATLSNLKSDAKNPMKAVEDAAQILDGDAIDMPFSLIYLLDKDGKTARLAGRTGLPAASGAAPVMVNLAAANEKGWPLAQVVASGTMALVSNLQSFFGDIPARHWPDPPHSAAVLPLMQPSQQTAAGLLVLGISPRRAFDDAYRRFFELASEKIAALIASADAFEQERRRAEALAELDRAKTTFFSNVSHEFRTPLTLMLGPMEELLAKAGAGLPLDAREQVSLAHRNSLRLLKLVNTLLDFSRIEAGRIQASYEPTDLASYTAELASVFRSAIEKAGLRLKVDCAPLPEPVYIDREIWEKIVLNLLSNAFKFTFEGEIAVSLRWRGDHAALAVRDTGAGIAPEEMPRIFERFHRIRGARARTHEGTGIGLALVHELVKLHGGQIEVASIPDRGTTFTISIPRGFAHLDPERIGAVRTLASTGTGAAPFIEEALRWLPGEAEAVVAFEQPLSHEDVTEPFMAAAPAPRARILLADDNADMRSYIKRLLGGYYEVEAVADGRAALAAAREYPPDLVLADIMMPGLDGIELLRELRSGDETRTIPIILLSARAGEESRVEGMEYGADDYLIKPFSARELMARVAAHLDMARIRREAAERIRQGEERLRALVTASFDVVYRMSPDWDEMRYLQGKDFIPDTDNPNRAWIDKYIHPDDQPRVLEVINEAIRTRNVFELEHRVLQVDGTLGWTHSRAVPLLDASGEIVEWVGTASDITERKNMEEIRTFQACMLAGLQEAICAVDENFKITFWNGMAEKIFGWTAQEAIGSPSKEIFKMISPSNREESIANILKHNGYTGEAVYRNKDGKEVYTSVICSVMWDARWNYKGNVSSFRDITERKKMEEELRESRRRLEVELGDTKLLQGVSTELISEEDAQALYEKILDAAMQIMSSEFASIQMLYPKRGSGGELRLLTFRGFSPEAAKRWDWVSVSQNSTCGEALRTRRRVIVPDVGECDYMRGTEDLAVYLQTGIRSCQTTPLISRNGTLVGMISTHWSHPHEPSERDLRLWDILVRQAADLIEHKWAEEAALASERELLKVTLDSLGEGVVAINREARIIFINMTAANLIGCGQDKAVGQPLEKVFYVFDDKTSEAIDIRIPRRHESNLMMLAGDLGEVPIALHCSPIKAPDGQTIGTVAVFQDISERLKTQQELAKADKLESLGILAGGIAHDFNNILGAILSNIQLATMKMEKNQNIAKYLATTVETAHRASELTKQLLTFAKGGAPIRKDASLIDLIKDTAEFAVRGAKTKVEFTIPDNLWPASIDEGQISQVIHNLVINAEQAMPRGGVIQITAANITLTAESRFKPGNYVKITVQDQGVGIPKDNLAKIFDPFFTTRKDGNGLGLSTVYSIIRRHDGYVEVESQMGVSTAFYIFLPAADGMMPLAETRREVAASGVGFKILLMDDEADILNAVGEMLGQYGYQVISVADGDAAIKTYQKAQDDGEPFDAVILDLTVPGGKGGQEVVAYLRDLDPQIKAIISSGYANDPIMSDFERFGFVAVVSKPYKIDALNKVLQKVLSPEQLALELGY